MMKKSIDLILVVVKKLLRSQENQKAKNYLSPKNRLNKEKSCQKVEFHLIIILRKTAQAF